ncbi:MAG: maleylacetoacetate isomerase [Pseudomonadota bacterium]
MASPNITLYGYHFSSTSYRARILLNLKSLPYDIVQIRLDQGEQHGAAFRAINPMGGLPVLEVDGLRLTQSPAISDYIEEKFPTPVLLPSDQPARQRVREITALIACDMHPLNNLSVLKYLRAHYQQDDAGVAEWYRHWIRRGFDGLEAILRETSGNGDYCVGDSVTMADVFLIPQVANARRFDIALDDYPTIESVDAHCQGLPAFEKAHPAHHAPADKKT